MTARARELLEAARQVAFFGKTDLTDLRDAVSAMDEEDRSTGYKDEEEI